MPASPIQFRLLGPQLHLFGPVTFMVISSAASSLDAVVSRVVQSNYTERATR